MIAAAGSSSDSLSPPPSATAAHVYNSHGELVGGMGGATVPAVATSQHHESGVPDPHMSYVPQLNPGPVAPAVSQQSPTTPPVKNTPADNDDENPFSDRRMTRDEDLGSYAAAQSAAAAHYQQQPPSGDRRYEFF